MTSQDDRSHAVGSALALRPSDTPAVAMGDDVRMQQLWLSMQQRPWRSLALVGANKGTSTIGTAEALAKLAWAYSGQPTCVFDLRTVSMRLVDLQLRDISMQLSRGHRVFIALGSMFDSPAAVPLARSADAVVMCVVLGQTDGKSAEQTLNSIGREHFLGSILVGGAPAATKPMTKKA